MNDASVPDSSSTDLAPPTAPAVGSEPAPDQHGTDAQSGSGGQPQPDAAASPDTQPTVQADEATAASIDLDAIERDLDDVQTALQRLDEGSYWTDEVTGAPIADDVLAAHPTARTAAPTLS